MSTATDANAPPPTPEIIDNPWLSEKPKKRDGPRLTLIAPYIYGPLLPLIRIGFRDKPVIRDRLFYGTVFAALVHGVYLCVTLDFTNRDG